MPTRLPDRSSSFYETVAPVRAFRGDLEELIDIMTGEGLVVTITSGGYQYADLAELEERLGDRPHSLSLIGKKKADDSKYATTLEVEIEFEAERARLSTIHRDALAPVLFSVRTALSRLRTRDLGTLRGISGVAFFLSGSMQMATGAPSAVHGTLTIVQGTTAIVWGSLFVRDKRHGVRLNRRHEGGFWRRNVERIIVAMIGAFIGAAGCAIATHYFGK